MESLLTWGTIQMLNEQKNNAMMRYLSLYAELHDTYIDSPLTPEEAKSRGYKAFHGYLGEHGNQAQFAEYISEVVSNECDSNINFDDTEYSSDASSDRSEVLFSKQFVLSAPHTNAHLDPCDFDSSDAIAPKCSKRKVFFAQDEPSPQKILRTLQWPLESDDHKENQTSEVTPNGGVESLPYHESDFSDLLGIILEDQHPEVSAETLQTEPSQVATPQQGGYEASQRFSLFPQPIASKALQHEDALSFVRSHVGGH